MKPNTESHYSFMEIVKMKKIDWFWFLLGIAFLDASILFIIGDKDWFIILVNSILGIMILIKSFKQNIGK